MDIKDIISEFEKNKVIKEEELKKQKLQEFERIELQAKETEKFMLQYLLPILNEAKKQINNLGYPCEVECKSKEASHFPGYRSERKYCFGIQFSVSNLKHANGILGHYVEFIGSHQDDLIYTEVKESSGDMPLKSRGEPVSSFNAEFIENKIKNLILIVFKVKD